jgi:hypothetical protein
VTTQLELDLFPDDREPAWRIALYGPVHERHEPYCGLDPRHHIKTPCIFIPTPEKRRVSFWGQW